MADTQRPKDAKRSTKQKGESTKVLRGLYERMVLVREFELRASEMYARAKIGGYCHLNLGEEATVVGLTAALKPTDYLFTTYRDHGYALMRGMEPGPVMAELFGKSTGVVGGYGIVGGQIPLATGAAFAINYRSKAGKNSEAVMCLLGDATTNIGAFHESLNLAGLWKLPIVYVIVNNRLGMGTPVELSSAEPDLYKRGSSYRISGTRIDGDDPVVVRDAALAALEQARVERQPVILEVMTYRLKGHSVVDPARYRSKEDTEEAQANDPVPSFRNRLLKSGVLDEKASDSIHDAAEKTVDEAVKFADSSPDPEVSEIFTRVYATPVPHAPDRFPSDPVVVTS